MSYIRWGELESDVYVYEHVDGYLVCEGCSALVGVATTVRALVWHLEGHRQAGDIVPAGVFTTLTRNAARGLDEDMKAGREGRPWVRCSPGSADRPTY